MVAAKLPRLWSTPQLQSLYFLNKLNESIFSGKDHIDRLISCDSLTKVLLTTDSPERAIWKPKSKKIAQKQF